MEATSRVQSTGKPESEQEMMDIPLPPSDSHAAAAKQMVSAMFAAMNNPGDDAISFTMKPNEDGTVDLTATEAVIAAMTDPPKECDFCHEVPCFYLQREEEIGNYMEYLFDEENMTNKERRYKMYRYLSQLYEGFLGKHVRKELPYCLVCEVKDSFPKKEGEDYTGFKESEMEGDK